MLQNAKMEELELQNGHKHLNVTSLIIRYMYEYMYIYSCTCILSWSDDTARMLPPS
eukprot:SAG22_NODE_415_length_10814_cov_10.762109_2_plen_56_part_00